MNKLIFSFLALSLFLLSCNTPSHKNATLSHKQKMAKASRTEKNGWIMIHVEGSPDVIGYQHGYLLGNEIIDLRGALENLTQNSTGENWSFYRDESYRLFWKKIPAEYQEEMKGIADGVNAKLGEGKVDIKDIVAINSFLETTDYYVPWLNEVKSSLPAEHCSAFVATGSWTSDGKVVVAHNNWSEYVIGERWNIIIDIVPDKGNRIVMDALPGFIHSGDDFNINSTGLIVTETTISQFNGFDTSGVAEFVRARKAIQYSSSIDEWAAIMIENNNGGYANDWLLADNKTGEIARLELGLKNHFLERTFDGCYTGANYPIQGKLIKEETSFDTLNTDASANIRHLRWEELMKEYKGKINIESAKKFMGDHYDMKRKLERAGRFTLCGHMDEDEAGKNEISWAGAFFHAGAVSGKATDSDLADKMQLWAIMGHPCGEPFIAKNFLNAHPEYAFEKDFLRDMPGHVWMLTDKIEK
jgi:hypothetical protein